MTDLHLQPIPFDEAGRKLGSKISQEFDVNGIPALVMLKVIRKDNGDIDFEVSNKNAVSKVGSDPEGEAFPWAPELVKEIDQDPEGIDFFSWMRDNFFRFFCTCFDVSQVYLAIENLALCYPPRAL